MSKLLELQRRVAVAVMQPLTRDEGMRQRSQGGVSMQAEADALIKPNSRLTSFERLEIYNRQYWFRVLSCFAEDFPGLRAIIGSRKFDALSHAYLNDCPSVSFTLRNLGSQLETWLRAHTGWIADVEELALDMVRLEWAHIEAFDSASEPILTPADIEAAGPGLSVRLQPYIRLLHLSYPVDDLLIEVRQYEGDASTSANAARLGHFRRRLRKHVLPTREAVFLAVHRMEDSVYYKRLDREPYRMLCALAAGESLEEALEAAFVSSMLPEVERIPALQQWFANWAELGWFCRSSYVPFGDAA
ncbi:MAG: putative DNA-binding domain-containing protein [Acidobacteriaceae bacterium]|nr:putative DNA-binding domain-containing protein [Acidobacteriaceae bacterium]